MEQSFSFEESVTLEESFSTADEYSVLPEASEEVSAVNEIPQKINSAQPDDTSFPYTVKKRPHSDVSEFTYIVDGFLKDDTAVITSLKVKNDAGTLVLDVTFPENGNVYSKDQNQLERVELYAYLSLNMGLSLDDINFDGYLDITLTYSWSRNSMAYAWIWDVTSHSYRYEPTFIEISLPTFNHEHRLIFSENIGGAAWHQYSVYQYIGGVLTLTNRISDITVSDSEIGPNGEFMRLTEEELVNGELVAILDMMHDGSSEYQKVYDNLWGKYPWNLPRIN